MLLQVAHSHTVFTCKYRFVWTERRSAKVFQEIAWHCRLLQAIWTKLTKRAKAYSSSCSQV